MAHHCGFTQKVLVGSFRAAGFQIVISRARPTRFDLWVLASKSARAEDEMRSLAELHFPR